MRRGRADAADGVRIGLPTMSAARQAHCKHRTFAHLARHGYVAAHHARELAREGKAEPRSAVAARSQGIGLSELLE